MNLFEDSFLDGFFEWLEGGDVCPLDAICDEHKFKRDLARARYEREKLRHEE